MKKTHNLAQLTIDEILHVGDTVIDAIIKEGDVTRFLASRVGENGHVMSFSAKKSEIDNMATSLFLSGLTARVEPIERDFTEIPKYLDPTEPISVVLFQIDDDTDADAVVATIKQVLLYLRTYGLIVLDGYTNQPAVRAVAEYVSKLTDDQYDVRALNDLLSGETALIIQRH